LADNRFHLVFAVGHGGLASSAEPAHLAGIHIVSRHTVAAPTLAQQTTVAIACPAKIGSGETAANRVR
jgi:hypothetical protein